MTATKYSEVKKIIEENPHLKNEELAKKVGRSISWIKAFKAFMNAEDKYKYKNSSNGVYRAIFNAWIKDIEAQKKEEENKLYKFKLQEKEEEIQDLLEDIDYLEKEISNLKKQYDLLKKSYQNLEQMKKEEVVKMADELCSQSKNKLEEKIKELENELHRVYYIQDLEKREKIRRILKVIPVIVIVLLIFFIFLFRK